MPVEVSPDPGGHPSVARARHLARLVSCLLSSLLASCAEPPPPPPAPPPEVVVGEVAQRDVPIFAEWVGTTDGNTNAQIRARVSGYLQEQKYTEGTVVRAGDLLFQIDPRPYRAALDEARGRLGRAEAMLTKTQQDVTRYEPLAAEGAVSQEELDNSIQAARAARAAVDTARATLEKAQLDLDWTSITSPIDGIAGISVAQIGDLIDAATVLTTVSQVDPIKVTFPISERDYLRFAGRINDSGNASPPSPNLELILADGSVHGERGTFSVADRQVDVLTGTMPIVALFPNPGNLLRPGLYAKVRATLETKKDALLVPQRAVQEIQGTYQVAVVGAGDEVDMRTVTPGARVGDLWVIDAGLQPGERVVFDGLQKVRDGIVVRPQPAAGAGA